MMYEIRHIDTNETVGSLYEKLGWAKRAMKKFEKTDKQPFLFKEFRNYEIVENPILLPVIIDGKKMIQAHL